jgi:hypothetical protein
MARDTVRDTVNVRSLRPDRRRAGSLRRTTQRPRSSGDVCAVPPSPTDDLKAPASRCPMHGASRRTAFLERSKTLFWRALFWAPFDRLAETAIKTAPVPRGLKKSRFNPLIHGRHSGRERGAPHFASWPLLGAREPSIPPARQTTPMKWSTWRRNRQAPKRRNATADAIAQRGETNVEHLAMGAEIFLALVKPWRPAACRAHPLCEGCSCSASRDGG